MTGSPILILSTLPDHDSAVRVAQALVSARLAACVSIGAPVDSIYHWRGKVETAKEVPVAIKTCHERYVEVENAIRAAHPYELPEIVAVPITDGYKPYLDWIDTETAPTP